MPVIASTEERRTRPRTRPSILPYIALWVVLIGAGIAGAIWYTDHVKQQLSADLSAQTARQIEAVQADYTKQLQEMRASYESEMAELESKVQSLNELLTFNKDNASDKTDSSNKLYTQISELKQQLDQLKKNLDVLK
ncbi:hypothetical protein COLU111180_06070 [Cohnella lubricantis]